jgi:hypothetical protein
MRGALVVYEDAMEKVSTPEYVTWPWVGSQFWVGFLFTLAQIELTWFRYNKYTTLHYSGV